MRVPLAPSAYGSCPPPGGVDAAQARAVLRPNRKLSDSTIGHPTKRRTPLRLPTKLLLGNAPVPGRNGPDRDHHRAHLDEKHLKIEI